MTDGDLCSNKEIVLALLLEGLKNGQDRLPSSLTWFLIRFNYTEMATPPLISRLVDLRALLVIAALCTLCISNNVGPSFLPLPVTDRLTDNPQENHRDRASGLPSPVEPDVFRVPMMGYTQKRVVKEAQPQPFAATLKADVVLPNDAHLATEFNTRISLFTSASVSQPPGRAPPRLA